MQKGFAPRLAITLLRYAHVEKSPISKIVTKSPPPATPVRRPWIDTVDTIWKFVPWIGGALLILGLIGSGIVRLQHGSGGSEVCWGGRSNPRC
jgi:hypothetical protein